MLDDNLGSINTASQQQQQHPNSNAPANATNSSTPGPGSASSSPAPVVSKSATEKQQSSPESTSPESDKIESGHNNGASTSSGKSSSPLMMNNLGGSTGRSTPGNTGSGPATPATASGTKGSDDKSKKATSANRSSSSTGESNKSSSEVSATGGTSSGSSTPTGGPGQVKSSPHHNSSSSSSPKNNSHAGGDLNPSPTGTTAVSGTSPMLGPMSATGGSQSSPSPSGLLGKDTSGNNMTAPSTPNSMCGAGGATPKGIPSVGNASLDQSQENDAGSMSDELALQSLLTAAASTSSAGVTPSTTPSAMCGLGNISGGGGDPMDSLRGVTDLLDGSAGSLLGLDTSTGSMGGGGGGGGGTPDGMGSGMPSLGVNPIGNSMSNVQMGGMVGGMGGPSVGNKGSCQMGNSNMGPGGSMDNTYMQNRIFVFSTQMANKGAEMVINGHFLSIIAYHCSQPETKKILENYPMKMGQFNRGNPAMANWMQQQQQQGGNLGMPGAGSQVPAKGSNKRGAGGASGMRNKGAAVMLGPNCSNSSGNNHLFGNNHMGVGGDCGLDGGVMPDFPPEDMQGAMASLAGASSSLQGVKIPNENLTPEQRAHREEGLEKLRQIQMMLLPENAGGPPGGTGVVPGGGPSLSQAPGGPEQVVGLGPSSGGPGRPAVGATKSPINPASSAPLGMMTGTTTTSSSSSSGDCALSKNSNNGPVGGDCGGGGGAGMMFGSGGVPLGGMGGPRGPGPQPMPPGGMGPGPGWKRQHSMPGGMGMMGSGGPVGGGGFPGGGPGGNFPGNGMPNMHNMGNPQFKGNPQQAGLPGGPMHGMAGSGPQHRMMMNGGGGGGGGDMSMHGGNIPPGGNGGLPPPYHQTQRSASVPMGGAPQQHLGSSPLHSGGGGGGGGGGMMSRGGGPGMGGMPFQKDWPGNGPMDVNSNNNNIVPCPTMSPGMNYNMPSSNIPPMGGMNNPASGGGGHVNSNNANISNSNNKEPNLMPVPSPQQIQYLNQFEGQELTIQKQPNSQPPGNQQALMGAGGGGGNNVMGMMDSSHSVDVASQLCMDKNNVPPTSKGPNSMPPSSAASPHGPSSQQMPGPKMGAMPKSENFLTNTSTSSNAAPNNNSRCGPLPPPGDPIASLTQMSQQLATGGTMTASSVTGGGGSAGAVAGPMSGGVGAPGGPSMMMPQLGGGGGPMGPNGQGTFPPGGAFMGGGPGPGQNFMNSGGGGHQPNQMMMHQMGHMHGQGMGGNGFPGGVPPGAQMSPMLNPGMGGPIGSNNPNLMRMGMVPGNHPGGGGAGPMMGNAPPPHMRAGPPQFMQQQPHMRPPFGPTGGGPGMGPGMPMMGPNGGQVGPGGPMQQQNLIQVKPNAPNTIQYLPTRTQLQQQQHQQQMMRGTGPIM